MRFDHQRPRRWLSQPRLDQQRAVWYGSYDDLACAVVELFGDDRLVWLEPWHLARPEVIKPLRLLDLRDNGAMRAGTVAEIAKTAEMKMTWRWSRYFYEESTYGEIAGLLWLSAHNDGNCIVLFERAEENLACDHCSLPLNDPGIRDDLLRAVDDHRLMLAPM
jgi:RES domain